MPTYNLFLNSKNCVNGSNVYQYTFPNGFELPPGSEIAINTANIPYSWINVSSTLGNNKFSYYINGNATEYKVTLANGFYLASDISAALQSQMKTNGHYFYNNGSYTSSQSFVGSISGTTLTVSSSTSVSLSIGTVISGPGVTTVAVTAATATVNQYTLNASQTAISNVLMTATTTTTSAQSQITPSIVYPLSISTFYPLYTNGITSTVIPVTANIASVYGVGYVASSSWAGGYPGSATYAYIVFPSTNYSTTTIGNILGFSSSGSEKYPSAAPSISSTTYGNSLQSQPPFPAKGSQVNGIIIRCSLIENAISPIGASDILDFIPITATYGSNISYLPISDNAVKIKPGKHQFLTITFNDDSFNNLQMLDTNILFSIIIRTPSP